MRRFQRGRHPLWRGTGGNLQRIIAGVGGWEKNPESFIPQGAPTQSGHGIWGGVTSPSPSRVHSPGPARFFASGSEWQPEQNLLDASQITLAVLILFAGSIVVSTIGFGMGMVAMPLLLLFLEPQTAVVSLNTVSLPVMALLVLYAREHLVLQGMVPTSVAGLLGTATGVLVLSSATAVALRIGIAALILLLTIVVAFNVSGRVSLPRQAGPPVGFVVGALVASLGIGGPLLVLFMLGQGWRGQKLRASIAFYLMLIVAAGVVGDAATGLYTPERVSLIFIATAPLLVGFGLGSLLVARMNERVFRRAVLAVIAASSLMVLAREVMPL